MTVVEMIARNARMYPDDVALIELRPSQKIRKEITWKQFDERVNRVANALLRKSSRLVSKSLLNWYNKPRG